MRLKLLLLPLIALALVLIASCASPSPNASPTSSTVVAEPTPPAPVPAPTIEGTWFWSAKGEEAPLFRAVATVKNPGPKAIEGVGVEWTAYDAENTIVGSYKGIEPDIPARGSIPYVAGAGGANLTGTPAKVEFRISNPGRFVEETSSVTFAVSDVKLKADEYAKGQYEVRAKVKTSTSLPSKTLFADLVLKNAAGKTVGGDWWFPEGLPDQLQAGASFAIEFKFVHATEKPVSADVSVTQRKPQ